MVGTKKNIEEVANAIVTVTGKPNEHQIEPVMFV